MTVLQPFSAGTAGIRISMDQVPPQRIRRKLEAFLETCPPAGWLQHPDFTANCPPPPRHRYLMLTACFPDGGIAGFGVARLTRLAPGRYLANFRRGPVTRTPECLARILPGIAARLRQAGCCSMQLNPRWSGGEAAQQVCAILEAAGGVQLPASGQAQHRYTALVDLGGSPEQLLARLKQRCRRQIRKAEKAGIAVRPAGSLEEAMRFEPLMQSFFRARGLGLEAVPPVAAQWQMTRSKGAFLLAWQQERLVAGHVMIADGSRAFWLVLARSEDKSSAAAGYPLVWEAMKTAQAQGFAQYDMAGAAALSGDGAEADPAGARNRAQFKSAFNPGIVPLVPAYVLPLRQPGHAVLFNLRRAYRALRAEARLRA
ncbi:lipid II:glycine glycyltransferase FemX [Leisingera thetidis]|uniref:lipid II:glycine glycyltransferase FemX n=1 Tax=Leisingera thetidis TaxID=2930199 RepID=UPI0021F77D62|nr:peptidoglycan bridge formation glycyltransferase FemA/FemB family protein [Leisingera thetidis]